MTRFSAIFFAQLAMSAAVVSMGGVAHAQDQAGAEPTARFIRVSDIGCVDGMPAPPYTQTCPPTTTSRTSGALAAVPRPRSHTRHKSAVQ
jgi:hypothetical protein